MKHLSFVFLFMLLVAATALSAYDPIVYENIHIKLLTIQTDTNSYGWWNDVTVFTFGYVNDADTMIYIPNSDPYFLAILPYGAAYSQSFIDLQYFYPGAHNTLYGPEFPADSGKSIWIKYPTYSAKNVLNVVKFKIGSDTVIIDKETPPRELPVQMVSFTAVLEGNVAYLNWITATEVNNSGFEIERSVLGSDIWTSVAFIQGKGTSYAENRYLYKDEGLAPNAYVYRIVQVDNDGISTVYLANQPKVDVGASGSFQLCNNYPNPFNPTTNLRFSVPQDGNVTLKVYNTLGQEVSLLFSGYAKAGHYINATFDASRFSSGIYFAYLQHNGKSLVRRMLLTK